MVITIFKNVNSVNDPHYIDVETAYTRIRDGKSKILIEKIRSEKDKAKRTELKKQLPSYCFSGTFKKREDIGLKKHSGLVAIDFDHLDSELLKYKTIIEKDKHTFMSFVSPSGDGLKVIVKIPANVNTHAQSCAALKDYYGTASLDDFKDVSRVCFESYDKLIYYNPKSELFQDLKEVRKKSTTVIQNDYSIIFENLVKWIEKLDTYQDGNKHKFLVKLTGACNRFGIPEIMASGYLITEYIHKAGKVDPNDFTKIVSKVYSNYSYQYGTCCFEKSEPLNKETKIKLDNRIFDLDLKTKDIIYLDSIRDKMLINFRDGYKLGETTYFKELDKHWSWLKGEINLFGGIMNHGKSTFVYQLALIKSIKDGTKWGVFSPEQNPPTYFYDDLIHTYIGLNTNKRFNNQMSEEQYRDGMNFVKEYFYYIYPENDSPTPEYINNCFKALINKHGIDGCITDPFNQLENDWGKTGRDDRYLSDYLNKEKRFALDNNIYKIIVAHPRGNLTKQTNGNYDSPNVFDFAGGAMWGNKCDNIIVVHRTNYTTNKEDTSVEINVLKIKKQKIVGIPGEIKMSFNRGTNRFYDLNMNNPLEEQKPIEQWKDEPIPF